MSANEASLISPTEAAEATATLIDVRGSGPVVDELTELGYTDVSHIEGGYPAWKEQGLPTVP